MIDTIASFATAAAVFVAAWQIWEARRQAKTQFEDGLNREYREIAQRIPVKTLLGEELTDEEYRHTLDDFYSYIDLSNEQVFLRKNKRISKKTWGNWNSGIKSNLARPAFRRAWEEVKQRSEGDFAELRKLEESGFRVDPRKRKQRIGPG